MALLCLLGQEREKCLKDASGDRSERDQSSENSSSQRPDWVTTARQNPGGPVTLCAGPETHYLPTKVVQVIANPTVMTLPQSHV